jgi:broad specificity phosphatase PhoE
VFDRILRFLRSVVHHHAGETVVAVTHADPIAIMRVGLDGLPFTAANLHSTVYPERASVTQITLDPNQPLGLTYFDVAGHVQPPSPARGSP